ncbi:hypothetical protein D3C84_705500 [compost metagenome]
MLEAACCRMFCLVILAVSVAKSASRIRERAADTFSEILDWLRIVESNRFCTAPNSARLLSTAWIMKSKLAIAICALEPVEPDMSSISAHVTFDVLPVETVTTHASAPVEFVDVIGATLALPFVALAIPDMVKAVVILKEIVCPASAPTWKEPL